MARLADYFLVVGYDLDKRGGCLSLARSASFNGVLLAVGKQEAEREAGTGQAATHHLPRLGTVTWRLAVNFGPGMRRPHGISVHKR